MTRYAIRHRGWYLQDDGIWAKRPFAVPREFTTRRMAHKEIKRRGISGAVVETCVARQQAA